MPGLIDWLFGAGPLKKAAQFGTATPAQTQPTAPVEPGISISDIAAAAQQQAARRAQPMAPHAVGPMRQGLQPQSKPTGKLQQAAKRAGGQ